MLASPYALRDSSPLIHAQIAQRVAGHADRRGLSHAHTSRLALFALIAGLSLCGLSLAPQHAHASTTVAADLDLHVPISVNGVSTGGGFGIRVGQELHVPLLVLNPEIGFTYATFSDEAPKIYRGIAGGRVGIGELFRVGVLGHVGFGHVSFDLPSPRPDPSHSGFSFDVGGFLELTALPLLNVGIHVVYNRLAAKDDYEAIKWLSLGAHAALVF
jgi:hypothetical protein